MKERRGAGPAQNAFFSIHEMPEQNWAYAIECRLGDQGPIEAAEWMLYRTGGVCHFRSEAGALERLQELNDDNCRSIALKVIEFRVVPKYVGYVPDKDEAWIKP